jgi:hypothetical protein
MLSMINGSAQRSIGLTGESMPDRAEAHTAIVQCCTRVVPLRTVNEKLKRDAMPDGANRLPLRRGQNLSVFLYLICGTRCWGTDWKA